MKRNIIKIEGNMVSVTTAPAGNYMGNELGNGIWMTVWEIAEAFNVTGTAVYSNDRLCRSTYRSFCYEIRFGGLYSQETIGR